MIRLKLNRDPCAPLYAARLCAAYGVELVQYQWEKEHRGHDAEQSMLALVLSEQRWRSGQVCPHCRLKDTWIYTGGF